MIKMTLRLSLLQKKKKLFMETRSDYYEYRYFHRINKPYLFFKAFL